MSGRLKWLLAAAVVLAVLTMLGTPSAEAGRWRVYARSYPAYYGPAYYPAPYYGPYVAPRVVAPPVVAPVYPGAVIVRRPWVGPVYRPAYVPYAVPYWGW